MGHIQAKESGVIFHLDNDVKLDESDVMEFLNNQKERLKKEIEELIEDDMLSENDIVTHLESQARNSGIEYSEEFLEWAKQERSEAMVQVKEAYWR